MYHNNHAYLNATNVSTTSFENAMVLSPELAEWIQAPGVALPDQPENGRKIIGEDNETEPATVNRPGGLEDLFFLLDDDLGTVLRVRWDGVRVLPRSAFVDLQELLGDVLDTANGTLDRKSYWKRGKAIRCDYG